MPAWLVLLATLALGCAPTPVTPAAPSAPAPVAQPDAHAPAAPAPAASEPAPAPRPLDATEAKIAAHVDAHADEAIALLERVVAINSGTMNHDGVRQVGQIFAQELEALGFETRWIPMDQVNRAGHLFAERAGTAGKRVLLIGHLDTVFERDSPFQRFERISPTMARGPGALDMKSGNIIILHALAALHSAGALDDTRIIVALTGDEESPGEPVATARKDLVDAAKRSDVALGFEQGVGGPDTATVARRGFTGWTLQVRAKPGHSSIIFAEDQGAGAIYEAARILHAFHKELGAEQYLTLNAGLILGGTAVDHDRVGNRGTASGKTNIIPQAVTVTGDLRALTIEQRERAKERMRAIVTQSSPHASAEIAFDDSYPPMAPTEGNRAVLRELERASRDLGLGAVRVIDPGARGAADISFVAPHVDSLAGLGADGTGSHAPGEIVDLSTLPMVTKRTALLLYRLTRE